MGDRNLAHGDPALRFGGRIMDYPKLGIYGPGALSKSIPISCVRCKGLGGAVRSCYISALVDKHLEALHDVSKDM